jgi:NAD(P)-dependent dehydrogenase (short-subunit alcohol dehydrogenase family)
VCRACGAVQYPPREACHRCLSVLLDWKLQEGHGELISETTVLHSQDAFFRERLPIRLGLVRLASGPMAVVYLHDEVPPAPVPVKVDVRLDKAGQAALVAFPAGGPSNSSNDPSTQKRLLREMSCDPRGRKVLVTDGCGVVGLALVQALVEAGAQQVWAGCATGAAGYVALKDLADRFKQVSLLSLDVTSQESVEQAATQVAPHVDVLISNAQIARVGDTDTLKSGLGLGAAQEAMEVHYFGLLRLAAEFAPVMRARAGSAASPDALASPGSTVTAWVNLLSIYALSSFPQESALSAAQAAAHSFSQSLRAQMLPAGIRVVNVFPGPVDVESCNRASPPLTLAPASLAQAIVQSLRAGVEDVYPGDVAQEWFATWRANPKVLERELSAEPQS